MDTHAARRRALEAAGGFLRPPWGAGIRWLAGMALWMLGAMSLGAADPLASWHPVELEWQLGFQGDGGLSLAMRAVSALGPGSVLAALMAAVLFAHDPRLATRLALLVFLGLWLREVLAVALQSPRPFWIEPRLQTFGDSAVRAARFGLPSGHALVAAAFWFRVALEVRGRRRLAWAVAAGLVVAIAVSRVYLGVHFISDVVTGVVVGTLLCAAYRRWEDRAAAWWTAQGPGGRAGSALLAGLALGFAGVWVRDLSVTGPPPPAWGTYGARATTVRIFFEIGGSVAGVGLGLAFLREWAGGGGAWWRRLLRLGVAGVVAKWGIRDPLAAAIVAGLGSGPETLRCAAEFVSGAVQGVVVWGVLPGLYLRWGWAEPDGRVGGRGGEGNRAGPGQH